MAVDLRNGYMLMNVKNETFLSAMALDKPRSYEDTYIDLEAALHFVKEVVTAEINI